MESFRRGVSDELKHFVYMLIDPRNGQTFYVGRGQGDRVFAHVNAAEEDMVDREEDNELPRKLRVIHGIKNAELKPLHVIHWRGMEAGHRSRGRRDPWTDEYRHEPRLARA